MATPTTPPTPPKYPTMQSQQSLLDMSNNVLTGFQNRYQYAPGQYNAPQMNAQFTPGQDVQYQQGGYTPMQQAGAFQNTGPVQYNAAGYTPMQQPGQFTGGPAVQYNAASYAPVQQAGSFGQQSNVAYTPNTYGTTNAGGFQSQGPVSQNQGGFTPGGLGQGMLSATANMSTLANTPWTSGYEGQAQNNINQIGALGQPQGNFQSGYGWQGQNLLQQGLNATNQNYSGITNNAQGLVNQANARTATPFQSNTTGTLQTLGNQANQRAGQGFGYDDPLVALQAQLARDAQQNTSLAGSYQPLQQQLISSAIGGLQRGGGLSGQEFTQSLDAPISILQREQQKALANLRDQMAAEGSYNTGRFQQMASENILEPYGQQIQNLVNQAYSSNLGNRTSDEVSRQQVANQILGQAFGTEAGAAQLGLQGLQTRSGVAGSLAEQALGADAATQQRIAQALGINQADLQRELSTENISQQRLQQAMDAAGVQGSLTAQMGGEQRANLGQAFDILQGNRGQELSVEQANQARRTQQLGALQAGQGAIQGQQGLSLAGRTQQANELQNIMNVLGMQANTQNQFFGQGIQNQQGAREDYATNLTAEEMNRRYGLSYDTFNEQNTQRAADIALANQAGRREDYATNLAGKEMANKYGLEWDRLSQADQQYLTQTGLANQAGRREDYATNLAGKEMANKYGLEWDKLSQSDQQYLTQTGLQNQASARADYTTNREGIGQNNQYGSEWNRLNQGDRQYASDVGFRNRDASRADTQTQLTIDALKGNLYNTGYGLREQAGQAAGSQGLDAIQTALMALGQEYGQYNTDRSTTLQNEQFLAGIAERLASYGIYGGGGGDPGSGSYNYMGAGGPQTPEARTIAANDQNVQRGGQMGDRQMTRTYIDNAIKQPGAAGGLASTITPGQGLGIEDVNRLLSVGREGGGNLMDVLNSRTAGGQQVGNFVNLNDPQFLPELYAQFQNAPSINALPEYIRSAPGQYTAFRNDPRNFLDQMSPEDYARYAALIGG